MHTRLVGVLSVLLFTGAPSALLANKPAPSEVAARMAQATTYQAGQSLEPLRTVEDWVRLSVGQPALRQELESGFIKLLGAGATFEAQQWACKQLGIIGDSQALPAIGKLLQSDDTAGIACLALSTFPAGRADQLLRTSLASAQGLRRIQLINTLGDRRDDKAVKLLAPLCLDPDHAVAEAAVASLGKIGDSACRKVILSLRSRAPSFLDHSVREAMVRCAHHALVSGEHNAARALYEDLINATEPPYVRRSALSALLQLDKDRGENRIVTVLHSGDAALKPIAIAAVRSLPTKEASERFARELAALEPREQVWLLQSLAARGDAAARDAAVASLTSSHSEVRRAAVQALAELGDSSSVWPLAQALARSSDSEESRSIEATLVVLGGQAATDAALAAELNRASGDARAYLLSALAIREGRSLNPVLLIEIENPHPAVAKAAFRALGKTATANEIATLLEGLAHARTPEVRAEAETAAAQALARQDPSRRSVLVRDALVRAHTPESRSSFLGLLPGCSGAAALATLKMAVGDDDPVVSLAAIRALAEWPDNSAWDILEGIYRRAPSKAARGIALRGLVRLAGEANSHPDAKMMECYRELLAEAKTESELRLILGTIGGAAHPDALKLVLPLVRDSKVHAEAVAAIRAIAEAIKSQYPQEAEQALAQIQVNR